MEDGNWQDGRSLAYCNKYMLTNSVSTDVTFIVGEGKREVRAHKYVLGSRCSVFYAMLFGPMAESTSTITIPDIEPEIFNELLRYMYYEEVSITTSNMTSLMIAADKYNVTGVVKKCTEFMDSSITVESVCAVLDCAAVLHKEELKTRCLEYIFEHPSDVLKSSSFCDLHRDHVEMILQSDDLVTDEEIIFEAVNKWGKNRCIEQNKRVSDTNIRDCLGDLITLVRFPLMDLKLFTNRVSKGEILTTDEKMKVFHWHFSDNAEDKKTLFCRSEERKSEVLTCMRGSPSFQNYYNYQRGYSPDQSSICFTVSDRVTIMGFVACGFVKTKSKYIKIVASLRDTSTELNAIQTAITTSAGEKTFRIMFKSGTSVKPGVEYTASITVTGQKLRPVENQQTSVTTSGITFRFHNTSQFGHYGKGEDYGYNEVYDDCLPEYSEYEPDSISGIVFTKRG